MAKQNWSEEKKGQVHKNMSYARNNWTDEQKANVQKNRKRSIFYDNNYFDSSWEVEFWKYCKLNGKNISRNVKVFKYNYLNVEHYCIPDFEVDGTLVEIKGNQFLKKDGNWQNPFDHSQDDLYEAKHKCLLENNVNILYLSDLKRLGLSIKK